MNPGALLARIVAGVAGAFGLPRSEPVEAVPGALVIRGAARACRGDPGGSGGGGWYLDDFRGGVNGRFGRWRRVYLLLQDGALDSRGSTASGFEVGFRGRGLAVLSNLPPAPGEGDAATGRPPPGPPRGP